MLKLSAVALAVMLLVQVPAITAHAAPAISAADQALASRIDASIAPNYPATAPGATVLVLKDGRTVLRKAYGLADVTANQAMTPNMTLRIGSITKQFTAVSILKLAEDGKLNISDDITTYLPDYPTHGKHITVEHLLTHTSGIVSYTGKPGFMESAGKDLTLTALIDTFKNDPLEFEPGSKFAYNNSGYILLGAIIEKVSGLSYADFVAQRIFIPLGMTQTAYEGHERAAGQRAPGYRKHEGKVLPAVALSMTLPYAAGALVSTVDDLARWDSALVAGKVISAANLSKAQTSYHLLDGTSSGYGYGWMLSSLQGQPTIGHGGGIHGYLSYEVRLPRDKVYVAILTNTDSPTVAPEIVATRAAAIAIGKPLPLPMKGKLDAKALDKLVGIYRIDDKTQHEVRRLKDTDGLTIQATGRGRAPLVPYSPTGFFIGDSLTMVEFATGPDGQATTMHIQDGKANPTHVRTARTVPEMAQVKVPVATLDSYVGRYPMPPGFTMTIARVGESLTVQLTGQPTLTLYASDAANFYVKEVDAKVRFEKNADGAQQLVLMQGGQTIAGKRE